METGILRPNVPIFYDGILTIISAHYDLRKSPKKRRLTADTIFLNEEYDDPLSLKDIEQRYPLVIRVIHEEAMTRSVYNFGNRDKGIWEKVGYTRGYA